MFGSIFEICSPSKAEQRTGAYSHPPLRGQRKNEQTTPLLRLGSTAAPAQLRFSPPQLRLNSDSAHRNSDSAPTRLRLSSAQLAHALFSEQTNTSSTAVPAKRKRLNLYQFSLSILIDCLFLNCLFLISSNNFQFRVFSIF